MLYSARSVSGQQFQIGAEKLEAIHRIKEAEERCPDSDR